MKFYTWRGGVLLNSVEKVPVSLNLSTLLLNIMQCFLMILLKQYFAFTLLSSLTRNLFEIFSTACIVLISKEVKRLGTNFPVDTMCNFNFSRSN